MDITSHHESGKVPMDLVHKLHSSRRRTSFSIITFDARKIIRGLEILILLKTGLWIRRIKLRMCKSRNENEKSGIGTMTHERQ